MVTWKVVFYLINERFEFGYLYTIGIVPIRELNYISVRARREFDELLFISSIDNVIDTLFIQYKHIGPINNVKTNRKYLKRMIINIYAQVLDINGVELGIWMKS